MLEGGEEFKETLQLVYGFTLCTEPKRHKWKSLVLSAWELTDTELEEAETAMKAALSLPLAPRKRKRDEELSSEEDLPSQKKEAEIQTESSSFPVEGAEHLSQSLSLSDELIKRLKRTVQAKEERFCALQTQVSDLLTQLSELK